MRLAKKHRYAPLGMVTSCRPGGVGRTIRPDPAPFIRLGLMFMCVSLRNCVLFSTVHTAAPQRTEWDDPLSAKLSFSTHGMSSSTPMSAPYWKTPRRFPRAVSRARLYRMGAPLVGNESPASTRLTPVDTTGLTPCSRCTLQQAGGHRYDRGVPRRGPATLFHMSACLSHTWHEPGRDNRKAGPRSGEVHCSAPGGCHLPRQTLSIGDPAQWRRGRPP